MPIPFCDHVMSSGIRCGSPAERGQSRCYYHHSMRTLLPKRFVANENFRQQNEQGVRLFPMPLLEDATSIQTALMQVIHAMLEGAIHVHTARIVLSALRAAQRNLPALKLEMASTCAAAAVRELPSDAQQKYETSWPIDREAEQRQAAEAANRNAAVEAGRDDLRPHKKTPEPVHGPRLEDSGDQHPEAQVSLLRDAKAKSTG